jgi:pilus assembly protein TadC
MEEFIEIIVLKFVTVLFSAIAGFIPIWLLWNWLMPYIFNLPELSIFQAFGLVALTGFLLPPVVRIGQEHADRK